MFPNVEYIKTLIHGLKEFVNSKIKSLPQSNWDQNDPTAKDYVKNRTHWVENRYRQKDYLIGLNTDGVSSVENKQYKNGVIPLVVGEQVQVSFVSYTDGSILNQCTAIVAKDAAGEPCIDQPIGMPITIYDDHAKYDGYWGNNSGIGYVIVTRTVALKHVHPMDAEYLANGQEKICWTESGLTELYANKNAEFKLREVYFYIVALPSIDSFGLVAGKKYRVVWDEVSYDCTCVSASRYGRNFSWIGNPALSAPYEEFGNGNEFPFCISTTRDGNKIQSNGAAASRPGKHSFVLYEIGDDVVHKIPDKYIPQALAVLYTQQTLTDEQKKQARFNISALRTNSVTQFYDAAFHSDIFELAVNSDFGFITSRSDEFSVPAFVMFGKTDRGYRPAFIIDDTGSMFETTLNLSTMAKPVLREIPLLRLNSDNKFAQQTMASTPTEDMHIATKKYVDDHATGGTDMGITGATIGQIAKITAVDASGVPTAWEPVDMPSGGGHWETVLDTVWEQDVINPTAYDAATGIFTCAEGELNNLELNTEYVFFQQCVKEGVAYNTIIPSGGHVKVTKLSDTTFSIDVTPPTTFVPTNVKFSKGACLAITDIDAKKIRLTLDGQFGATASKYNTTFFGAGKPYFAENVSYIAIQNAYHAYQQVTAEVESPYRIVGEILCGFNAPSQNASFHFKNNSFCCPLIPYDVPEGAQRNHFLTSDGTKIAKLYSTSSPWQLGGGSENTAINNDYLSIISGTKVKLERWVE